MLSNFNFIFPRGKLNIARIVFIQIQSFILHEIEIVVVFSSRVESLKTVICGLHDPSVVVLRHTGIQNIFKWFIVP